MRYPLREITTVKSERVFKVVGKATQRHPKLGVLFEQAVGWSCFKNMYRLKTCSNRFWFNTGSTAYWSFLKKHSNLGLEKPPKNLKSSMAVHQRDDEISHFFGAAVRINASAPSLFSQRHPCRWNCRCGHTCWKMKDPEKRADIHSN